MSGCEGMIALEVQVSAEELATHFGDYWQDFAEFLHHVHRHDLNSTIRGQARQVVEDREDSASAISAWLRRLAEAIDVAIEEDEE